MRIVLLSLALLTPTALKADGYEVVLEMPIQIDLIARRAEILGQLPVVSDSGSRRSITAYRQELDRFNTIALQGFLSEINASCERMNALERKVNKSWSDGDLTPNQKRDFDDAIKQERENCSDRFATTSPYYDLYYEILEIYRRDDERSILMLSECTSSDKCRES